jgi:hypothetical protein
MATGYPFGNDPAKIARYRAFWDRAPAARPLIGFSFKTWFPLDEFSASAAWQAHEVLTTDMVDPEAFLDDQERLLREGETLDDDILRGASPSQAVPWLDGMLDCRLRILPSSILGEARHLSWEQAAGVRFDPANPWFQKYIAFVRALVRRSAGRFPVSHGTLIGPTDMVATLRGHSQSIVDLFDEPEPAAELLARMGELFAELTVATWRQIPLFYSGTFDAQYALWAPGPTARLQEDATALYSPALYRRFVQPVDRALARRFSHNFIHLHSTSNAILEAILEVEELRCFEVNYDVSGPPLAAMMPYYQMIQRAGRPLLIRGSFTADEARLLMDGLDPRGLLLYVMVSSLAEVEGLRPLLGM